MPNTTTTRTEICYLITADQHDLVEAILDFKIELYHLENASESGLTIIKNFKLESDIDEGTIVIISMDNYQEVKDLLEKYISKTFRKIFDMGSKLKVLSIK